MPYDQVLLMQIDDPDNPGKKLAYRRDVYVSPKNGEGYVDSFFRVQGLKVEMRQVHVGSEPRQVVPDWTAQDEPDKPIKVRKTRIVKKPLITHDADGKQVILANQDFNEVYYDDSMVPNPHPARAVIQGVA